MLRDLRYTMRTRWRIFLSLPRRAISIRSAHHVFNAETELEELNEGDWCLPHMNSLHRFSAANKNLRLGGANVVA
jgi:hypothetical protein